MSQLISLHTKCKVLVTSVAPDGTFFVQLDTPEARDLPNLSDQIQCLVHNNPGAGQGFLPSPGKKCFVKFEDTWRRALVLKPDTPTSYTSYYVDYGDIEPRVPLNRILPPIPKFFEMPFRAVHCKLANFVPNEEVWSNEIVTTFADNVLGQEVPCLFHGEEPDSTSSVLAQYDIPCYLTTLYWEDSDDEYTVAEELVAMEIGTHPQESPDEILSVPKPKSLGIDDCWTQPVVAKSKPPPPPLLSYQYLSLEVGQKYNVYISYAESPDVVWCQFSEYYQVLETMVGELQHHMATSESKLLVGDPLLESPLISEQPCCVMYSQDNNWCRGQIQEVDLRMGMASVLFVDFGNTEEVSVANILCLHPKFFRFPVQAMSFSMYGIAPTGEEGWSNEAKARFEELYSDQELLCYIEGLDEDGYPSARLQDLTLGADLASVLIKEGHAIDITDTSSASATSEKMSSAEDIKPKKLQPLMYADPNIIIGKPFPVCVTSVESLGSFYCQLLNQLDEFAALTNLIGQHCTSDHAQSVSCAVPNLPVLAKYSEDNSWYRASLHPPPEDSNQWSVVFVDYGNSELISLHKVYVMPDTFLHLPCQSFQCALINAPPSPSDEVLTQFTELVLDQEVQCVVNNIAKGPKGGKTYCVQLLLSDGTNVLDDIFIGRTSSILTMPDMSHDTSRDIAVPPLSIPVNETVAAVVCFIESVSKFACQLSDSYDDIEALTSSMNEYYMATLTKPVKPVAGAYCAALFAQDDSWYRGRMTSVSGKDEVCVYFIDFGNSEVMSVSKTRQLASQFLSLPSQAIICSLESIPPSLSSSDELNRIFEETCLDKSFQVTFASSAAGTESAPVLCKLVDGSTNQNVSQFLQSKLKPLPNFSGNMWLDKARVTENILKTSPKKDNSMGTSSGMGMSPDVGTSPKLNQYKTSPKYSKSEPLRKEKRDHTSSHSRSSSSSSARSVRSSSSGRKEERRSTSQQVIEPFRPSFASGIIGKISCVVSPLEFYVQPSKMSQKLSHLMENLQSFYGRENMGLSCRDLTPGSHCVCLGPKEVFYRCQIKEKKGSDCFEVLCIDYGTSFDVTLKNLFSLSERFTSLPRQAICCSLNDFVSDSDEAMSDLSREMKHTMLDREVEVTFTDHRHSKKYNVDVILRQKLSDLLLAKKPQKSSTNHHLPLNPSSPASQTCSSRSSRRSSDNFVVSPLLLLPGQEEKVLVSSLSPSGEVYCQLCSKEAELNNMMLEIESYANARHTKNTNFLFQRDWFVLGQFTGDDSWYRAKVLELSEDEVLVFYVDYGNQEYLSKERILPLPQSLVSCPSLAVCCELEGLVDNRPTQESYQVVEEKLIDACCLIKVTSSSPNGRHVVKMICIEDNLNISEWIINKNLFAPINVSEADSSQNHAPLDQGTTSAIAKTFKERLIKPNETLFVYISHVEEDGTFWVQPVAQSVELGALCERLNEVYSDSAQNRALQDPQVGQACCARYSDDGDLYRAIVTSSRNVTDGTVGVFFVDYGNCDFTENVYELLAEFHVLPALAVRCKMGGNLRIPSGEREEPISLSFVEKENNVWIIQGAHPSVVEAELSSPFPRPVTPTAEVIVPSLQIKPDERYEVYIVHTMSPNKFWCQLVKYNEELEDLMALMADYYTDNELEVTLELDNYCVAQYSVSKSWYRAKILKILSSEEVEVSFIDYGNIETLHSDKIQGLHEQFAHFPAQAVPCSLFGSPSEEFTTDQLELFFSLNVDEESFHATLKSLLPSGHWHVLLEDQNEQCLNNLFISPIASPTLMLNSGTTPTYRAPAYPLDVPVGVFVTCVSSPDSFYCQPLELAVQLEELINSISSFMSENSSLAGSIPLESLYIGQPCLACYTTDSDWYRGLVKEIDWKSKRAYILYVDYGNIALLFPEQISPLPPQFLKIPTQSLHCSVVPTDYKVSNWPREVVDKMLLTVAEKENYTLKILSMDGPTNKFIVKVLSENEKLDFSFIYETFSDKSPPPLPLSELDTTTASSTNINGYTPSSLAPKNSKSPTTDLDESEEDSATTGEPLIHAPCKLSLNNERKLSVRVAHVQDPLLVYLQRVDCSTEFESLSAEICQYCTDFASQLRQTTYQSGDFVLASSPVDGGWLRACVSGLDSTEGFFKVAFIDYGYEGVVSSKEMVMCPENFLELPIQAIPCSLTQLPSRDNWPEIYQEMIQELSRGKELEAHIVVAGSCGIPPAVTLLDKGTGVEIAQRIQDLLQEECEAGAAEVQADLKTSKIFVNERELEEKRKTDEDDLTELFEKKLSLEESESKIEEERETNDELIEKFEDHNKTNENEDDICANDVNEINEESSTDANQQQSTPVTEEIEEEIEEVELQQKLADQLFDQRNDETHTSMLVLVDSTEEQNIDNVDNEESEIVEGEQELNTSDQPDIVVTLNEETCDSDKEEEEPPQDDTKEEEIAPVETVGVSLEQQDSLRVSETITPPPLSPLCTPDSGTLRVGSIHNVFVVNITSPSDFVCHLSTYSQVLDAFMAIMSQIYDKKKERDYHFNEPPAVGNVVCAKYSKDDNHYRARIVRDNEDETFDVEYIDYGYNETISFHRLFILDSELSTDFYPPFALRCSLFGFPKDLDVSLHFIETLVSLMRESLNDKEPATMEVTSVPEDSQNGGYVVKLTGNHKVNINDLVLEKVKQYTSEEEEIISESKTCDVDLYSTNC